MHERVPSPKPGRPEQFRFGKQLLILSDCMAWLAQTERDSVHAVVTDPPYGLIEYAPEEQKKLRSGRGGVWRIPPSFDGSRRRSLPRFTILTEDDRKTIFEFFFEWTRALVPVLRPGAHVFVATNPLISPVMSYALEKGGLERRGEIVRLVRTFRGGDRPKGAEGAFEMVSTMPRSCWEPWALFRKPLECRTVSENLRKWQTGGLRRVSKQTPFLDVIQSSTTPDRERELAPHPSLKPQHFLRQLVRAALPVSRGTILDPFAGAGSTLGACEHLRINGIGIEQDTEYFNIAKRAIPALALVKAETTLRQRVLPGL